MRARGDELLGWARSLDAGAKARPVKRPEPKPPLTARPKKLLGHRDRDACAAIPMPSTPNAFSAWRRSTGCCATPALPSAARCSTTSCTALPRPRPTSISLRRGRSCSPSAGSCFGRGQPAGRRPCGVVAALRCAGRQDHRLGAAAKRSGHFPPLRGARASRHRSAAPASPWPAAPTASTWSDAGSADILDYKTGSSPSKGQAHTLVSPQLALEGCACWSAARSRNSASCKPHDLAFVRLRTKGEVERGIDARNTALAARRRPPSPTRRGRRLEQLLRHYAAPPTAICRARCRSAKARWMATTTIWRGCSNGRPAPKTKATRRSANEAAAQRPAGDGRAPGAGVRSRQFGLGVGQCRGPARRMCWRSGSSGCCSTARRLPRSCA